MKNKLFNPKNNKLYKFSKQVGSSTPELFHISFRGNLEGKWSPKRPDGDYDADKATGDLPETVEERISVSPSIEQCFQAIYANVKHFYKEGEIEELTFYVYTPVFKGDERIVYPEALVRQKLVHDAHITKEHCIISPTFMKLKGKVKIKRPDPKNNVDYYAYGVKTSKGFYGWLPGEIKVKVIK